MCADLGHLAREVSELDIAGADVFHMDIMDGDFVPNFALSWQDVKAVRKATRKLVDAHLMVRKPEVHLPFAFEAKVDIIYVHFESENILTNLRAIREKGIKVGLAINPETSPDDVSDLLPSIDRLLIMRVHPGFAGQKPLPKVEKKIAEFVRIKRNFLIGIDGAVSPDVVTYWSAHGVDEFILGTSALFGKCESYADLLTRLHTGQVSTS